LENEVVIECGTSIKKIAAEFGKSRQHPGDLNDTSVKSIAVTLWKWLALAKSPKERGVIDCFFEELLPELVISETPGTSIRL
jgi:hypothetical protein